MLSGMADRVKVIAEELMATVADAGASTPVRVGGFCIMLPPQKTREQAKRPVADSSGPNVPPVSLSNVPSA